jgi:phosphoenolpyruvate-protein kinase (PTS system EI component)
MAGEPMIAPVLFGLGIRELSMSAVSIPEVKATVRQITVTQTEALVERVRNLPTAADVRAVVTDYVFGLATPKKEPV